MTANERTEQNDTDEGVDVADSVDIDGTDGDDQPFIDPPAAQLRDGEEAGFFYDEAYKPGEVGAEAGIIAGSHHDEVLVTGVGYPLLSDLAFGTVLAYRVADLVIPGVAVADSSHTPIAAYQTLTDGDYHTAIMVGAEKRGENELNDGNPSENPGRVHEFGAEEYDVPDEEELVDLVGESAMGSNTVENVLVVSRAFGGLPETTHVVTAEVGYDSWGMNVDEFTDPVEAAFDEALDRIIDLIDDALDEDVRAGLDDPLSGDLDEEVLDQLEDESAGPDDGREPGPDERMDPDRDPSDPQDDEFVDDEAIARMDDEARDMLEDLGDDVVADGDE